METVDLINALRRMAPETGCLPCLGCGHEHGCSVHGCAVLKEAADRCPVTHAVLIWAGLTPTIRAASLMDT